MYFFPLCTNKRTPHGISTTMIVNFFQRRGIYYGWVILVVAFFTLFIALGFRFSFGVFYVAILDETGWSRADTAGIFSTAMIVYAITCLLAGAIFDSFGPRVLFPFGLLIFSTGLILAAGTEEIWELYLYYGVLVGVGFSMLGFPPHMAFIPRWFVKQRGFASSLALSGIGLGSLLITVFSEEAISAYGWRTVFTAFGIGSLVFLMPLMILLYRSNPESIGLFPDGLSKAMSDKQPSNTLAGPTLFEALQNWRYWVLFVGVSMIGLGSMTLVVHQTRMLVDLGYSLSLAAGLFGVTGLLRSFGGVVWGWISDRAGRRWTVVMVGMTASIGVFSLLVASHVFPLFFLGVFVFFWGMGLPAIAPVYGAIVADNFHGKHLGKIMGTLDQGYGLGAALGPFAAGFIFDNTGSYQLTIWALLGVIAINVVTLFWADSFRVSQK